MPGVDAEPRLRSAHRGDPSARRCLAAVPERHAVPAYEDVARALEWLTAAFGFEERLRLADEDGSVSHAGMRVGDDGVIMLGQPGLRARPRGRRRRPLREGAEAGAVILREPSDQPYGDRRYDAEDPEGHHWSFAHRIREVAPEGWGVRRVTCAEPRGVTVREGRERPEPPVGRPQPSVDSRRLKKAR